MVCTCCGLWAIDQVVLDGVPRLRLKHRGFLVGAGYYSSPAGVAAALQRQGGPGLASFTHDRTDSA